MGKNYIATTPGISPDAFYQAPLELMYKAAQNIDDLNDMEVKASEILRDKYVSVKAVGPVQQQRLKEINNELDERHNTLVQSTYKDPLNYKKRMEDVRQFSRDIQSNLRDGELGWIQQNALAFQEAQKYHKDTKEINPMDARLADAYNLSIINSSKWNGNKGDSPQLERLMPNMDIPKYLREQIAIIKPDGYESVQEAPGGGYLAKKGNSWENIDAGKAMEIFAKVYNPNTDLGKYVMQRGKIGALKGVLDENTGYLSPLGGMEKVVGKDGKVEEQFRWSRTNPISLMMQSVAQAASYSKQSHKSELSNDSRQNEMLQFENSKALKEIELTNELTKMEHQAELKYQGVVREALLPKNKDGGVELRNSDGSIKNNVFDNPFVNSKFNLNGGNIAISNSTEDVTVEGIDTKLKQQTVNLLSINKVIEYADKTGNTALKKQYEEKRDEIRAQRANTFQMSQASYISAMEQTSPEDKAIFKEIQSMGGLEAVSAKVAALKMIIDKKIPGTPSWVPNVYSQANSAEAQLDRVQKANALKEKAKYQGIINRYKEADKRFQEIRNNALKQSQLNGSTSIDLTAVTPQQSNAILTMLKANPKGFTVYGTKGDGKVDSNPMFDGKAINFTGSGVDNSFMKLLSDNNIPLEDAIHVESVFNRPHGDIGVGVVFSLKVPGSNPGQKFVMTMPSDTRALLGQSFYQSNLPSVKQAGENLLTQQRDAILGALTGHEFYGIPPGEEGRTVELVGYDSKGKRVTLKATAVGTDNPREPGWILKTKEGNVPVGGVEGSPGYYPNSQAVSQGIYPK